MAREDYIKAGEIASRVKTEVVKLVKPGTALLKIACFVDEFIEKEGAKPAFPVNISIDDVAAHYTPVKDDESVFEEGQIVKLDIGVAVNNCPADTAVTVTLGDDLALQKAAEAALDAALAVVGKNTTLHDIGAAIESAIKAQGFRPITNLTGHSMSEGTLHAGLSIPNYPANDNRSLGEGVFAIEPFATTGEGRVKNSEPSSIYRLVSTRQPRMPRLRKLQGEIAERFGTLPFAARWVEDDFGLRLLTREGVLHNYPLLKEVSGAKVSQAEETILIEGDEVVVTTKAN